MAVQLTESYMKRSYQLLSNITPISASQDEAFEWASNIIFEWVKIKVCNVFRKFPAQKTSYEDEKDGSKIGIIYKPDEGIFTLRFSHPDKTIASRIWITDTTIKRVFSQYVFAVRLSVTSPHSCTDEVPFSCPEFVKKIIAHIGISDEIPINNQCKTINNTKEVHDFISLLKSTARTLPVVLITPYLENESTQNVKYMMDSQCMAEDLNGISHVFEVSRESNYEITELIGKQWSAYNGSVRTYYPHLSLEEDDCYRHPMIMKDSIVQKNSIDSEDCNDNLCMHEIEKRIQNFVSSQRINWENNSVEFYFNINQRILSERRTASHQTQKEMEDSYELQILQLKNQIEEIWSLANSYSDDCEDYKKAIDEQREREYELSAYINTLRQQLVSRGGINEKVNIPSDIDYENMESWVKQNFPDKLILMPRAIRRLKDANFEDVELVYKCIVLLATKYYDFRMNMISRQDFDNACKEIDPGIEEALSSSDITAGMNEDEYTIMYHGEKQKLDHHLKKGVSRDPRFCLRIYFFWDNQRNCTVIGYLPDHLSTKST